MNTLGRLCGVAVPLAMMACAGGCIPIVIGAGMGVAGYKYFEGELEYSIDANVDNTRKAAASVIKERGWDVKEDRHDVTTAYYRCITQDGTQVEVNMSRRSPEFTRVAVRYGVWGDEVESKKFIEQMKARL